VASLAFIYADQRSPQAKEHINARIKYREKYRPFAPAVLHEKSHRYFQVPEGYMSNYMEKVVSVREEFREKLPAITHVDGSGRLQTVQREHNPVFHGIISQFEEITSYPVVLNTSFNLNGEPIVLSPSDALSTFYSSGLEHLFLGNYYVTKCL